MFNIWWFVFVVGVLIAIFLHELGHFVTAQWTGMKATQFFIGFGPRLWSFRRGETEYGVRALPLGAFVRIIGMNNMDDVPEADEARTYRQQSYPKRLLVISAGSIMHMMMAVVLLFAVYSIDGEQVERAGVDINELLAGGPADAGRHPCRRRRRRHRRRARSTARTTSATPCSNWSRATPSSSTSCATANRCRSR